MSRIIITGGAGLIGRALAASLAGDGSETIVLSRNPGRVEGLPHGTRVERWDGRTSAEWGVLAEGAAAIVNLAGEPIAPIPWTAERKRRILSSRVEAGHAVAQAIREARTKPGAVIQASAVGYYGVHGPETLSEESPPGDDFLSKICLDWERSTADVEEASVRRAVIRTGVVLSRRGGSLPLISMPFRFFLGGPLGSGQQYVPWIHIDDHVRAIRFLIDTPAARGVLNLTAPSPVTSAEFSRALGRAMGRPAVVSTPAFAMQLVFGDMARLMLLGGQRVVPKRLQELGFEFRFKEIDAALGDLYRS